MFTMLCKMFYFVVKGGRFKSRVYAFVQSHLGFSMQRKY